MGFVDFYSPSNFQVEKLISKQITLKYNKIIFKVRVNKIISKFNQINFKFNK